MTQNPTSASTAQVRNFYFLFPIKDLQSIFCTFSPSKTTTAHSFPPAGHARDALRPLPVLDRLLGSFSSLLLTTLSILSPAWSRRGRLLLSITLLTLLPEKVPRPRLVHLDTAVLGDLAVGRLHGALGLLGRRKVDEAVVMVAWLGQLTRSELGRYPLADGDAVNKGQYIRVCQRVVVECVL